MNDTHDDIAADEREEARLDALADAQDQADAAHRYVCPDCDGTYEAGTLHACPCDGSGHTVGRIKDERFDWKPLVRHACPTCGHGRTAHLEGRTIVLDDHTTMRGAPDA